MLISIISHNKPKSNPRRFGIGSFAGTVSQLHAKITAEKDLSMPQLIDLMADVSQ